MSITQENKNEPSDSDVAWEFRHAIHIMPWLFTYLDRLCKAKDDEERETLIRIVETSLPNYWDWHEQVCDRHGFHKGGRR